MAVLIPIWPAGFDGSVLGSAAALLTVLLLAPLLDPRAVESEVAAIAAAIATLAAGSATALFRLRTISSWPAALCMMAASFALAVRSLESSRLCVTAAILLVGASALARTTSDPAFISGRDIYPVPGTLALIWALVGMVAGTAAVFVAAALHDDLVWQIAGTVTVGIVALGTLVRRWRNAYDHRLRLFDRANRESRTDALTGLSNRRGIEERLNDEVARAIRFGHPLAVLMIDLDDFKSINDRYGHAAGDDILRSTAVAIDNSVRSIDIAGRYGGEEFLVVLPETDASGAEVVAERIRASVERLGATVSIGLSPIRAEDSSASILVGRADEALYEAKRTGKNRIALAA
jgi:diguanylate cyclase (GGDEF)-like protein